MIEFLIHKDIDDSTLINTGEISLIGRAQEKKFLDEANEWYYTEAFGKGVNDNDIVVYDPNIDTKDERNRDCKKLAEYMFLMNAFFSLIKSPGDVYEIKMNKAESWFNKLLPKLTADSIMGVIQPNFIAQADEPRKAGFRTIIKILGDATVETCNSDTHDCSGY